MSNEIIKSNKKLIITLNNPNGEYLDMTAEEISQREIDIANETAQQQAKATARATEEANKASAKAKLEALGLTEEEIKALIG